jgi:hypothetical protein
MESRELAIEKFTNQYRNLNRKYDRFRTEYEKIKDVYYESPTFTNYRKLHAIHSKLIRCSDELSESQTRLIEAYWSFFGIRHWQFRLNKEKGKLARA